MASLYIRKVFHSLGKVTWRRIEYTHGGTTGLKSNLSCKFPSKTFSIVHFGQFLVNYVIFVSFRKTNYAFWPQMSPQGETKCLFGGKSLFSARVKFSSGKFGHSASQGKGMKCETFFCFLKYSLKLCRALCISMNFLW